MIIWNKKTKEQLLEQLKNILYNHEYLSKFCFVVTTGFKRS